MSVKNVEKLKDITYKIKHWSEKSDTKELAILISELEKISRKEKSEMYVKYFSDVKLALKIIFLTSNLNKSVTINDKLNKSVTINAVSLLGNMMRRYGLPTSDELFEFFFSLKDKKKIDFFISLFITFFPQFNSYEDKWSYIVSIAKIAPREKSQRRFYLEVKKIIASDEKIPSVYKTEFINQFENYLKQFNNKIYVKGYKEIIKKEYKEIIKKLSLYS